MLSLIQRAQHQQPPLPLPLPLQVVPVAACAAGAHLASIFSMNLGAVSFAQIVKASEPAFAAVVGMTLYGKSISKAKWLCLIPVIGGVCLASIKELGAPACTTACHTACHTTRRPPLALPWPSLGPLPWPVGADPRAARRSASRADERPREPP